MLGTLGVTIPMIREAYGRMRTMAALLINRSDPYPVHEMLVNSLVKRLEGVTHRPLVSAQHREGEEHSVLILGGRHHEAASTCHIIRMLLQRELQKGVGVLDRPLDEALSSTAKGLSHIIVVLSAGLLHDIHFARCLILLAGGMKVRAVRADDGFAFPDEQFWSDLNGGIVLDGNRVNLEEVEKVYREMFKIIATTFTPHASSTVHRAEMRELIKRMDEPSPLPSKPRPQACRAQADYSSDGPVEESESEEEQPMGPRLSTGSRPRAVPVMPGEVPGFVP